MGLELAKFDIGKFDPSDADEFVETALVGLSAISTILGAGTAGSVITGVVAVIQSILQSLQAAYDGKVPFEQVRAEFEKLVASINTNDALIDTALDDKFKAKD
jgi:hypothetical protein